MKDVAALAEVSLSTVSYVVNNTGPVSDARRRRVQAAIDALGFVPDQIARNLKSSRAATIGVIVPDLSNEFFASVVEGIQTLAAQFNVLVTLMLPAASGQSEDRQIRLLRNRRLDGYIYLTGSGQAPPAILNASKYGPVVLVDEQIVGSGLPAIVASVRDGAFKIAEYVFALGHRNVAIISGPQSLWTAEQRLQGYLDAARSFGIQEADLNIFYGDYRIPSGESLAGRALHCQPTPTALICANDLMALGAMKYCTDHDICIPGDVSITGFDDITLASLVTPRLTTVCQPGREMGSAAMRQLMSVIEGKGEVAQAPLETVLRIRGTVSRPYAQDGAVRA
jgi:LacI family transcriptional regulator